MFDEHGEEQDEKTKRDLDILKKYHKKEIKSVKKIFITLFLIFALVYIVKLLMGFFSWRDRSSRPAICKLGWAPRYESQPPGSVLLMFNQNNGF